MEVDNQVSKETSWIRQQLQDLAIRSKTSSQREWSRASSAWKIHTISSLRVLLSHIWSQAKLRTKSPLKGNCWNRCKMKKHPWTISRLKILQWLPTEVFRSLEKYLILWEADQRLGISWTKRNLTKRVRSLSPFLRLKGLKLKPWADLGGLIWSWTLQLNASQLTRVGSNTRTQRLP